MKKQLLTFSALVALALPAFQANAQSELQVIHNCADPAAATVDIYVNGTNALNDFAFRTATPFIALPSGVPINIGVAPGTSSSVNDTLVNFTVTLSPGVKYVAIANGVLNPAPFAVNPEGNNTGFGLTIIPNALTASQNPPNVDLAVNHGSTDAPAVDVIARGVATLVDNAAFGDVAGYLSVPASDYILDITPANDNSVIVASFKVDLTSLAGGAGVVFASGFLNPAANQNGAAFGLFAALTDGTVIPLQAVSQARLQVIHNAADPGAASVDVYLNGALALDDFAFRKATPFIDVPAGTPINIGIAPPTSTSVNDTLVNFTVTLENGKTYLAVANGVLAPGSFAANPDGRPTAFTLFLSDGIRESAQNPANVEFIAIHGATDAPTVDVLARNVATLVDNAAYSDITGYLGVPPASYILDVTPGNDNSVIVASFTADLSTLAGGSAVVFASGFLNPAANQNGEAFGLFAALADGTVIPLPAASQARLQVIHNAADPGAASVDVYLNGALALDDFAFRTATPFIDVPAGTPINIGIAPPTSTSVNDTLVNFTVTLDNGKTYLAVANGVLTPGLFAANPDGRPTAFTLFLTDGIRESAQNPANVEFIAIHGSTDAPTVDILARNVATLVDNAAYSDITGYLGVPPASYILDITPGNDNSVIVASFTADLSTLAGGSAVVFASGFLDPAANQNGEAFGLFAALADGTVIPFPAASQARLQAIHNAADPAAATVDVYVNGALAIPSFAFRSATPFLDVPAGVTINLGIAPANSSSVNDTLVNFPVVLENGETYVAIANGVLAPGSFAANPDGRPTGFTLWLQDGIRESAVNAGEVDFIAVHGATDAPTVDIKLTNGAILVDNAAYSDITGYLNVPAASYSLDVTPGNDNSNVVASYQADLTTLAGGAAVIFASGFLNPAANQNGEAFGLWVTLPDGTTFPLPVTTSLNETEETINTSVFPNPVIAGTAINISSNVSGESIVEILNISGQVISSGILTGEKSFMSVETKDMAKGVYIVRTINGNEVKTNRLIVQ